MIRYRLEINSARFSCSQRYVLRLVYLQSLIGPIKPSRDHIDVIVRHIACLFCLFAPLGIRKIRKLRQGLERRPTLLLL